jgi:hypothetical protein
MVKGVKVGTKPLGWRRGRLPKVATKGAAPLAGRQVPLNLSKKRVRASQSRASVEEKVKRRKGSYKPTKHAQIYAFIVYRRRKAHVYSCEWFEEI